MALFNKRPKTSTQKAQKAQLGILARLIGCAYLIYIVIQLMRTAPEDDILSPTLKIVISVFFLCAAAAVIVITVLEFIRNWKSGFYKPTSYADDIIETYAELNEESTDKEPTDEEPTDEEPTDEEPTENESEDENG